MTWVTLVTWLSIRWRRFARATAASADANATVLQLAGTAGLDCVGHGHVGRPLESLELLGRKALVVALGVSESLDDFRGGHRRAHDLLHQRDRFSRGEPLTQLA